MANIHVVEHVLESISSKESKFKSIEVQKDLDLEIDEGNLLAVDPNELDAKNIRSSKEDYLLSLARDNCQLLINRIWDLPVSRVQEAIVVKLPDSKTRLPREKPVPKPKPETKWQKYAKLKGIQNKKKGRMAWDEELKEWKPRWGFKRVNDPEREWVLEVPDHVDPMEDQFAKLRTAKKERVAKNELQRLRNIARNAKGKAPGVGLVPTNAPDKHHVDRAIMESRKATASLGQFTEKVAREKPVKNMGKKRKFQPNYGDSNQEKKRMLNIFGKVHGDKPTLDINKAVNHHIAKDQQSRSAMNREGKGNKKGGKKGASGGKKGGPGGKRGGPGGKKGGAGGKKGGPGGKKMGGKFSSGAKPFGGKSTGKKGRK